MGSERGGWHRGRYYALFSVVSFLPSSRYHSKVLNLTEQWELELLVSSLNLVLSPTPTCLHLSEGQHLPPNCSRQSPRTHLWLLSLLFHQHVQLILSPKFVSDAFTSMSVVPTSVPTTVIYFLDVYHTLLTGTSLFTLPSFSLPEP